MGLPLEAQVGPRTPRRSPPAQPREEHPPEAAEDFIPVRSCPSTAARYETRDEVKAGLETIWVTRVGTTRGEYGKGRPAAAQVFEVVFADGKTNVIHGPVGSYMLPVQDVAEVELINRHPVKPLRGNSRTMRSLRVVVQEYDDETEGPTYRFVRCEDPPKREAPPAQTPEQPEDWPWWTKPEFLGNYATQKALLTDRNELYGSEWNKRADCLTLLRDYEKQVDEVIRAGGNLSSWLFSSWQYCAARFFPADNRKECRASIADYRRLAARDQRFRWSHLPDYLESFCGVRLPKR